MKKCNKNQKPQTNKLRDNEKSVTKKYESMKTINNIYIKPKTKNKNKTKQQNK